MHSICIILPEMAEKMKGEGEDSLQKIETAAKSGAARKNARQDERKSSLIVQFVMERKIS